MRDLALLFASKFPSLKVLLCFFPRIFPWSLLQFSAAARYEQNYTYYISTRVAQAADPQPGAWTVEVGLDGAHEKIQRFNQTFLGGFLWKTGRPIFVMQNGKMSLPHLLVD